MKRYIGFLVKTLILYSILVALNAKAINYYRYDMVDANLLGSWMGLLIVLLLFVTGFLFILTIIYFIQVISDYDTYSKKDMAILLTFKEFKKFYDENPSHYACKNFYAIYYKDPNDTVENYKIIYFTDCIQYMMYWMNFFIVKNNRETSVQKFEKMVNGETVDKEQHPVDIVQSGPDMPNKPNGEGKKAKNTIEVNIKK